MSLQHFQNVFFRGMVLGGSAEPACSRAGGQSAKGSNLYMQRARFIPVHVLTFMGKCPSNPSERIQEELKGGFTHQVFKIIKTETDATVRADTAQWQVPGLQIVHHRGGLPPEVRGVHPPSGAGTVKSPRGSTVRSLHLTFVSQ